MPGWRCRLAERSTSQPLSATQFISNSEIPLLVAALAALVGEDEVFSVSEAFSQSGST
jgi:hypothetical protein